MYFIIASYGVTLIIYLIFPNMQQLRPTEFARDNIFTRIVGFAYSIDTNTNVFPSLHVIGSLATLFAFWFTPRFSTVGWRITNTVCTVLICLSTVFIKQHSVLDILGGLILCAIIYPFVYKKKPILDSYKFYTNK